MTLQLPYNPGAPIGLLAREEQRFSGASRGCAALGAPTTAKLPCSARVWQKRAGQTQALLLLQPTSTLAAWRLAGPDPTATPTCLLTTCWGAVEGSGGAMAAAGGVRHRKPPFSTLMS